MRKVNGNLNLIFMEGYPMNKLIAGIFFCVGVTTIVYGQESDLLKQYKGKFPDAPAVFVERSEVLSILVP